MAVSSIIVVIYAVAGVETKVQLFRAGPFKFLSQKIRLSEWLLKVSIENATGIKVISIG